MTLFSFEISESVVLDAGNMPSEQKKSLFKGLTTSLGRRLSSANVR